MYYGDQGCWSVAPVMVDEGDALPEWDIRVAKKTEYSMGLYLRVPVGTSVRPVSGFDEDMLEHVYIIPEKKEKEKREEIGGDG